MQHICYFFSRSVTCSSGSIWGSVHPNHPGKPESSNVNDASLVYPMTNDLMFYVVCVEDVEYDNFVGTSCVVPYDFGCHCLILGKMSK